MAANQGHASSPGPLPVGASHRSIPGSPRSNTGCLLLTASEKLGKCIAAEYCTCRNLLQPLQCCSDACCVMALEALPCISSGWDDEGLDSGRCWPPLFAHASSSFSTRFLYTSPLPFNIEWAGPAGTSQIGRTAVHVPIIPIHLLSEAPRANARHPLQRDASDGFCSCQHILATGTILYGCTLEKALNHEEEPMLFRYFPE